MGIIVEEYKFSKMDKESLMKPIIYCNPNSAVVESAISVNITLAKAFKKQNTVMMRTMRLESNLLSVLKTLDDNSVIKEFDVIFNPAYQTDILHSLINVYKKKAFCNRGNNRH